MKRVWNILLFAFFVFCLFLFKPRQDIVFGAIDESQYIRLFENGKDFELCIEDDNTFTGSYLISMDTVFLSYREHIGPSTKILPKKLFINKGASNIKSTDNNLFFAEIYLDMRQKTLHASTKTIRKSKRRKAHIYALGEQVETQSAP